MTPTKQTSGSVLDAQSWQTIKEQADVLVKSGFLPPSVKSAAQAIAIALKGKTLGWDLSTSLNYINIIQGKPTISAEGMLSLIYSRVPGAVVNFTRMDDKCCMIEATRPGGKPHVFKFDENDAKAAGLLGRGSWKSYPRAMYRSRCISEMARSMFPDAVMGCSYTPEEIQGQDFAEDKPVIHKLYKAQPVIQKKSFDKNNPKHLEKIKAMLSEKSMEEKYWEDVIDRMQGRPSSDLNEVCSEVLKRSDWLDDFEIPFGGSDDNDKDAVEVEVVNVQ